MLNGKGKMTKNEYIRSITKNGLIVPDRWDANGNITGIALAGFDETSYPILMDRMGKTLVVLMNEEVTITGELIKEDNADLIKITSFT